VTRPLKCGQSMSLRGIMAGAIGLAAISCGNPKTKIAEEPGVAVAKPIGNPVEIKAPLGLPPVPIPANNKATADTIALGRKLYYDPQLSIDGTVACANCHSPVLGFTDRLPVSEGVARQHGKRNA